MDKLQAFYNDKAMMEAVYNHFVDYLNRQAIIKVYEKKDTLAIPEAKEAIDGAITELHDQFGIKKQPKEKSPR